MSCACGSFECTCRRRCLCATEDCTCERCDDLRSGRTLGSEDLHTQVRKNEEKLQASVDEKLETIQDPLIQSRSFGASLQEPSITYSGRMQKNISSISEKLLENSRSSLSTPQTPRGITNEQTAMKRSFSSPGEIFRQCFDSAQWAGQSNIQSKYHLAASSDTGACSPVKKFKYLEASDRENILMEVDPSSETDHFTGNKSKSIDENVRRNLCQGKPKSAEAIPASTSTRNISPNSTFNPIQLLDQVQLSPGRKYTVMVRHNILSSSTELLHPCPSSATAFSSNDNVSQLLLPQSSLETTRHSPKPNLSQETSSDSASESCQQKSSDASGSTQKLVQSPEVDRYSTGKNESNPISDLSSRRCMPIISPPPTGMQSNSFDFSWVGSPERPSSVESYFDRIVPCSPPLRPSGRYDDMIRMNRIVQEHVEPIEEFRKNLYQYHVRSEVENLSKVDEQSIAPDSAESSRKADSESTEKACEETSAEVQTAAQVVNQGDLELDERFILKGLPYDLTSEESNPGSENPSDTERHGC